MTSDNVQVLRKRTSQGLMRCPEHSVPGVLPQLKASTYSLSLHNFVHKVLTLFLYSLLRNRDICSRFTLRRLAPNSHYQSTINFV